MLTGYWIAQAVHVAAQLGIADLLRDGPRTIAYLAEATGTHARSLYRLLRALASEGVFVEDAQGRFGLTPLAECLRSDAPDSQRSLAIMNGRGFFVDNPGPIARLILRACRGPIEVMKAWSVYTAPKRPLTTASAHL